MSSPALNEKVLGRISDLTTESRMTLNGTVNKTGILVVLTVLGAMAGWGMNSPIIMIGAMIISLVCAFAVIWGPQRAPYLAPVYALSEGLMLGAISATYSHAYGGIVSQALFLTVGCLAVMLGLYRFRIIRVTEKVRSIILAATLAIALTYVIEIVMNFFGHHIPLIHQNNTYGIAFSVFVVGIAAMNLLLDFDMIERAYQRGAPKFMEWYGGFALLLTLVWLYLEILRLLAKSSRR